jgi:hypothetical protein
MLVKNSGNASCLPEARCIHSTNLRTPAYRYIPVYKCIAGLFRIDEIQVCRISDQAAVLTHRMFNSQMIS